MPLLTSPIDGSPMRQINRFGIEIDVCPSTGGVWLDKGELEKLMAMIREAAAGEQQNAVPAQRAVYREPQEQQYQGKQDQGRNQRNDSRFDEEQGQQRRRGGFADILDIFDFG